MEKNRNGKWRCYRWWVQGDEKKKKMSDWAMTGRAVLFLLFKDARCTTSYCCDCDWDQEEEQGALYQMYMNK